MKVATSADDLARLAIDHYPHSDARGDVIGLANVFIAIRRRGEPPPVSMDFQRSRLTDFQRRPLRLLLAHIEKYGVLKLR